MLKSGIDYQTKLPQVKESLQSGIAAIAALSPLAYRVQGYAQNRVLFNPTISRLNQAISGEMTLPDAWTRISSDVQDALQAQAVK
jgi:alpha-1,4-digalacturonate transport system substrate-binding protein